MDWHYLVQLLLHVSVLQRSAASVAKPKGKRLAFSQDSKCTYSYEVAVHAARGSKSTEADGYQLYALVSAVLFLPHSEELDQSFPSFMLLKMQSVVSLKTQRSRIDVSITLASLQN